MKTYQPKEKEIKRTWHLFDAKDKILGRLASEVARVLIGKGKTSYVPHLDMGEFVVVKNAEKVRVSGKKEKQKVYYRHSGYPGGLKKISFQKMKSEHPERIIKHAVSGMLPDNRLKAERLTRLKVIIGDKNPYEKYFSNKKLKE